PGDREIEIRLEGGAQIAGTVVDAETGEPIPEARISVRDVSDVTRETFTDERGQYLVGGLSEGRAGERMVNVDALGYARISNQPIQIQKGKLTEGVDFRLYRTGGVSGVVVNDAGAPVIRARVFVRRQDGEAAVVRNLGSGVTNADGRFRMLTIEPGAGCSLLAQHSMYLDSQSEPFEILPGVEYADLKIVMAAGGAVSGRVVDGEGRPIEGATVKAQLVSEGLDVNFMSGKTVRSDGNGAFLVGGLEPGAYIAAAEAAGYLTRSVTGVQVVSGRTTADIEIRLGEGSSVAGRVMDPAGEPISGATVTVTDTSEGSRREVRTTNARGEFRIDSLGQSPVEIEVKMDGYQTARRPGVPVNSEGLEFILERLGTMRGTAYDETGNPVTAYSVRPEMVSGDASSAAEGLKTITAASNDGVFEYKGLAAGTYRVYLRAPGYAGVTIEGIQVRPGETAVVPDAVLSAGGILDGQVVDARGRAIEGAQVSIVGGASAFRRSARPTDAGAGASVISRVRTGPDGRFEFAGLRDGVVKLSVEHPAYITAYEDGIDVTLRTAARGRRIVLEAGAEIAGVVVDGAGKARPDASVYLQTEGRSVDRQVSDADGRFRFGGLAPGLYVVRVHEFARPGEAPRGSAENVTVRAGQIAQVRLELRD
ncbi:MAG: carboxypeptidase regulatory-like domain-containing protein, partial [Planctomycetes bacterium]|nr:carboxypeptidase regulatory-like domain-containing protein [Planctomycetota bacterium]